jgi:hypothetical protein
MERAKIVRGLRIALSAVFGIVCVLLIALWVQSYWWQDCVTFNYSNSGCLRVYSVQGRIATQRKGFAWSDQWLNFHESRLVGPQIFTEFTIPYWCCVLLSAMLAVIPWLPWSRSFSLRTLLIATTLIAVLLGLAVWAVN